MVVAQSTALTAAFRRESRNVPIVFIAVGDPIGAGFIVNLARPGSNLTGLTMYEGSIAGKWLAMVKEIDPRVTRAALSSSIQRLAPLRILRVKPKPWPGHWRSS